MIAQSEMILLFSKLMITYPLSLSIIFASFRAILPEGGGPIADVLERYSFT
jgi:hypothetical protein